MVGEVVEDIRIPHKGNIQNEVIEGAFRVLDEFEDVEEHTEAMKALSLEPPEEIAFATAALALRFGERVVEEGGGHRPMPVTVEQLIEARRPEDLRYDLWTTFQRVQENDMQGGQPGRSAHGRRLHTGPVGSIDRGVSLNRALWMLAEVMRKLGSDRWTRGLKARAGRLLSARAKDPKTAPRCVCRNCDTLKV